MRDQDRLKEKLEVSLDSRQIFFLFFGGALVACLVFVVGVMVGGRLEVRKAKKARPGSDELALVDNSSKTAGPPLTFHDELIRPDARTLGNVPPEVLEWRSMGKGEPDSAAVVALRDDGVPQVAALDPTNGSERLIATRAEGPEGRAAAGSEAQGAGAPAAAPARLYTLQVSAYQNKSEADQMVKRLQTSGYRPYIVSATIPNRGVWYRVRVGSFGSWKQAMDAKANFEGKLNLTAYVSRR